MNLRPHKNLLLHARAETEPKQQKNTIITQMNSKLDNLLLHFLFLYFREFQFLLHIRDESLICEKSRRKI